MHKQCTCFLLPFLLHHQKKSLIGVVVEGGGAVSIPVSHVYTFTSIRVSIRIGINPCRAGPENAIWNLD